MPTLAFVANDNALSVVDTSTNTVINTITVNSPGDFIKKIAITPDGRFAYVTNLSSSVSVIDICTNTVVDTIIVGDFPVGIVITPDGRFAYVANSGLQTAISGSVSVIDTSTNTVIDTIPVGRDPIGVAITPDGKFVYVTIAKDDNVTVIDTATNTVIDNIPVGDFPEGISITPNGNFAYVANLGQSALTNTVSVIDTSTNTVVDTIPVGEGPIFIAITPDGNFVYVTTTFDTVDVIDTSINTVIDTVDVGHFPIDVAITPDGGFAYVTNFGDNNVSVIKTSTNTVVDTIPVGGFPLGIAIADVQCPATLENICIETTRVFDSCMLEDEKQNTFEFQYLKDLKCEILRTKCNILNITKIEDSEDLVDIELQIKVFLGFTSKWTNDGVIERVVSFHRNVTLISPEDADVSCEITNVSCVCNKISDFESESCDHKLKCRVKVTAVVKSKKLVQIEIPFLGFCEPRECPNGEMV